MFEKSLRILELTATIWGTKASHNSRVNHTVTRTNCTVTIRTHLPKRDMCPTNTKQHLLRRFAEKLKRRASAGHLWPYVTPDLIRLVPSKTLQNAPRQRPEEFDFLVLCLPRVNTRIGAIVVRYSDVVEQRCDAAIKEYDMENRWKFNRNVKAATNSQTAIIQVSIDLTFSRLLERR